MIIQKEKKITIQNEIDRLEKEFNILRDSIRRRELELSVLKARQKDVDVWGFVAKSYMDEDNEEYYAFGLVHPYKSIYMPIPGVVCRTTFSKDDVREIVQGLEKMIGDV